MAFSSGLRAIGLASLVTITGLAALPAPAAASTVPSTSSAAHPATASASMGLRVVRIALAQRGDRYVRGATGPRAFDCSGLVRYAYRRAHAGGHLGGGHSARAMLRWGRAHHRTSRTHPRLGDVAIYGGGTHAAIWIGNGRVISALNPRQGIRITRLHALGARFTTFIHTNLSGAASPARHHHGHHAHRPDRVVVTHRVNVRAGHSTHTRVVAVASRGRHFVVTGTAHHGGYRWLRVSFHGHARWVWAGLTRGA